MNEESLTIRLVLISTVLVITLLLGASISSIKKRTAVRPILSPGWSTVVNEGLQMVFKDAEIIKKPLADGGVGVGALTFLDGELILGINLVKQLADFDATIDGADWIITVEGQLDEQTLSGKTIDGVITSARLKKHTRCGIMWFGEYKCKIAEQIWSHICFFNCERYFYVTRSHQ